MKGSSVLVVDDDPLVRRLLAQMARREGFEAMLVPSGAKLCLLAQQVQPACIVLDLDLGEHDGRDLLARLKANPATASIPVYIHSARTDQATRLQCLELGAEDYVVKPAGPTFFTRVARKLAEQGVQVLSAPA